MTLSLPVLSAPDSLKPLSVSECHSVNRLIALAITADYALPHQNRHERTRQPHLAKYQEWTRCRIRKFELIVDDEMREDHLHDNGYVEAGRAGGSQFPLVRVVMKRAG